MRRLHAAWLLSCILLIAMPAVAAQGIPKGKGAAKGRAATAAPRAGVLARVGNETITEADVEGVLRRVPARQRAGAKQRVLNNMIELYVFANEAKKVGMLDDPQVKKRLKEATTLVLARRFRDRLKRRSLISDKAARKAYEERKANLLAPEELHLQRILVKDKAKADELLARLKKGESFEELARKESQDPMSASKGGDLGWRSAGSFPTELRKAALALKAGELSEPIPCSRGYYIAKLIGKKDKRQMTFDEVKKRLKIELQLEKYKRLKTGYLEKADVQIFLPEEPKRQPRGQASEGKSAQPAGE